MISLRRYAIGVLIWGMTLFSLGYVLGTWDYQTRLTVTEQTCARTNSGLKNIQVQLKRVGEQQDLLFQFAGRRIPEE